MINEAPGSMDIFLPFGERDDWTVTSGGQVIVVRGSSYSVEWYSVNGSSRRSAPITDERVTVTEAEKDAWWKEAQRDSIVVVDCRSKPCKPTNVVRPALPTEWPTVKNPFEYFSLHLTPNGDLWVKRSGSARDTSVCYDVVSQKADIRQVLLPLGRTVMALSATHAYAVAEDEDGLQLIEEYRLPR